ncbi:MAG TPA: hypothetical protein PJ982_14110, partial [Lacipirellulaceae bacterium]|nr:hypothetical protein [Lacipirellulaceae bacterium]
GAGGDILRVYDLADGTEPRAYDAAEQTLGPIVASGRSATGEGALASLSHSEQAAFVVPRVGDRRGWILKAILDGGRLAGLEPFLPVGETTGGDVPSALVINPKPHFHYLVAAHGARTAASRVTMFSPASGAVALRLNTGLRHIVGLAYSPSGDLYAVDYGGDDPASGGVYRLEAAKVERRESCRPVKIADAPRPTALAFSPDGLLYVTALGEHSGDDPATGVLLRIAPLTETPKL